MKRRTFAAGALALAGAAPYSAAMAQQQGRVPRIAYLSTYSADDWRADSFRQGLRDFGYQEGNNVIIEYFSAPTVADLPRMAALAVASNPNIVVAVNSSAAAVAKSATSTLPIVLAGVVDPVAVGLVQSLGRPGGNVTGPALISAELSSKWIQMLNEFVPGFARMLVLNDPQVPSSAITVAEIKSAADKLGIEVRSVDVSTSEQLSGAFAAASRFGAQAVVPSTSGFFVDSFPRIAELALQFRVATIHSNRALPDSGGLLAYGSSVPASYRRAAYYVDRILKGAKPADLPVEQPMTFDLVINKRTANALGLKIPEHLLVFATEVIE